MTKENLVTCGRYDKGKILSPVVGMTKEKLDTCGRYDKGKTCHLRRYDQAENFRKGISLTQGMVFLAFGHRSRPAYALTHLVPTRHYQRLV
ncbi:MAG: hypothetical protein IJX30_05965 [Clostridia bacterium]|nr:hypothetical protein [Clostridia bacterium]